MYIYISVCLCVDVCVCLGMCVYGNFGTCCDSKLLAEDPRDDWQHKTSLDPSIPRSMHY